MNFNLTEEQILLRDMVRDFVDKDLRPIAATIDREEKIPSHIITQIADLGLLGAVFPVEYGGSGLGKLEYCLIVEEIARACMSTATFIGAHVSIAANSIYISGSESQKIKYLPDLISGKKIAAFALTESNAGSDASNLSTTAEFDEKLQCWILNGEKQWITNAPIADVFIIYARTSKGITSFILEKCTEGFNIAPAEKKMGIRGSQTSSLSFNNVKLSPDQMLGREGRGFIIAMKSLDAGRLGLSASCLGASKELLKLSLEYSKKRKQFGEPISNFQAIQFMLAEMEVSIFQLESSIYRTASMYDAKEAKSKHCAIVKLAASEVLDKCADYAMQIHGGIGYSAELPIERFYRDARINRIFEGTSEVQKILIANDLIKRGI